jgi:NTE family protein
MWNGPRIGIVLSGTAPAMTLMSGVMLAFAEYNIEFEVISTAGVGGLVGMLYLAAKDKTREEALRALPNLFVSDWIYRFVPINFKVFHKYGPLASTYYQRRKSLPKFDIAPGEHSPLKRFANDWMDLWATTLTPPSLGTASNALMSHVPLIDDLVDFKLLKGSQTRFYLNAFSLYDRRLKLYDNRDNMVTPDVYNGAQAMFMLFPPVKAGTDLLVTGASHDPTALQAIWMKERDLWGVLALEPFGKHFWRAPTDVYDAFQLMLMTPIASLQEIVFGLYGETEQLSSSLGPPAPVLPRLYMMHVLLNPDSTRMLNWSYENAVALQKIGYRMALPIAQVLDGRPDRATLESALASYRYARGLLETPTHARPRQVLRNIFDPVFSDFGRFATRINTEPQGRRINTETRPDRPSDPDPGRGRASQ